MKLELRTKGLRMTSPLRRFAEKKLKSALGRFSDRVHDVKIRLTDINGPRGGEDIHCNIRAGLGALGTLTINETQRDPFAAIALASGRIGRHMSRRLSRANAKHKRRRGHRSNPRQESASTDVDPRGATPRSFATCL